MESISEKPESTSSEQLLDICLRGGDWSRALLRGAIAEGSLLRTVVERLGDEFDPHLCDVYARLMHDMVAEAAPELLPRIRRARTDTPWPAHTDRIYVLSRITLGADVAVTSVLMDAAKRRYPAAHITFVGPRKNYELFAADHRVDYLEAAYGGTFVERLQASASLWFRDGLVIDPDSRLTQLGMVRVCDDERYFFFESRSAQGAERLPDLAALWAGDPQARPYIAPLFTAPPADITVSLGVGENASKRLNDGFEHELLRLLAETGMSVLVDLGASPEERERVTKALQPGMRTYDGSYAPFAAAIARSKLFVGYDSAGGHVASACGVPLISIARGFVNERMAARWRPLGTVIDASAPDPISALWVALITYTSSY